MEKWHRKTSSFHLLVGEVSITLDDVMSLLHLPIVGTFHTFEPLHVDEAVLMLVELLEVSKEVARAETTSVMDHTYAYLDYEIYIKADVRPDIGLL